VSWQSAARILSGDALLRPRTGGDYALTAQQRVARIKANQSGVEAAHAFEEFARAQPGLGPDIVAARAGLVASLGDQRRSIEILDAGLVQYPDSIDLRMARVAYERRARDAAVRDRGSRASVPETPW
jgi:hypothetical protein